MFDMLDLPIAMFSSKKSYIFPFKRTSVYSALRNPLEILMRKIELEFSISIVGSKFKYILSINKQIGIMSITM